MSSVEQLEAMSGLEPGQISLVPHDSSWSDLATGELARIREACPDSIIAAEHIGSSSVSGILSRPVLDLMIGVQEMMQSGDAIQPLKLIGYRCHGEQGVPGRRFFTLSREARCLVHVHLYRVGSPLWESALAFRDHLRGNPESAAAYDELRVNCMKTDPGDLPAYEKAKRDFEANAIA